VTIYERGEQSAIDVAGDGNVIRLGHEVTDGLFTVPVTFDLVSVFVEFAASVTMGKYVGVVILEGGLRHGRFLFFVIASPTRAGEGKAILQ
jgi:hypothetical protein